MGKIAEEQYLRLGKLLNEEKKKIRNRKKPRWVDCFTFGVPALFNDKRNEDWARKMKEKIAISQSL